MGKFLTLVNGTIHEVEICEELTKDNLDKPIKNEGERFDFINNVTEGGMPIEVYSNENFDEIYNGKVVKIKKGVNAVAPMFAIYLFGVYGVNQHFGEMARLRGIKVSDEPLTAKEQKVEMLKNKERKNRVTGNVIAPVAEA